MGSGTGAVGQARTLSGRIAREKMGDSGAEVARSLGGTMSSVNRSAVPPELPDPNKFLNAL